MTHTTEEIERLMAEATPGPWSADCSAQDHPFDHPSIYGDGYLVATVGNVQTERWETWEADAALIVAAVNALPELVAKVKRYEAALTEARTWHEAADKAISKQPNANQGHNGWNRLQHQEQIRFIDAALSQEAGS